jgi:hypothetical protein
LVPVAAPCTRTTMGRMVDSQSAARADRHGDGHQLIPWLLDGDPRSDGRFCGISRVPRPAWSIRSGNGSPRTAGALPCWPSRPADGQWAGALHSPKRTSTAYTVLLHWLDLPAGHPPGSGRMPPALGPGPVLRGRAHRCQDRSGSPGCITAMLVLLACAWTWARSPRPRPGRSRPDDQCDSAPIQLGTVTIGALDENAAARAVPKSPGELPTPSFRSDSRLSGRDVHRFAVPACDVESGLCKVPLGPTRVSGPSGGSAEDVGPGEQKGGRLRMEGLEPVRIGC